MNVFIKKNIKTFENFFNNLFISNIVKFSIICFRDYYFDSEYIIKKNHNSFISNKSIENVTKLIDFIKEIKCDGGNDEPEAIEAAFEETLKLNYQTKNPLLNLLLEVLI